MQGLVLEGLGSVLHKGLHIHLEDVDRLLDAIVLSSLGMELTHGGNDLTALLEDRRLARMHGIMLTSLHRVLADGKG